MQGPRGGEGRASQPILFHCQDKALILPPSFIPKGPCSPQGAVGLAWPLSLTRGHGEAEFKTSQLQCSSHQGDVSWTPGPCGRLGMPEPRAGGTWFSVDRDPQR